MSRGAAEWTFPDYPLRGVYAQNEVYLSVRGWESFQPWLSTTEGMSDDLIWNCANGIPPEWYASDWGALEELVRSLLDRRTKVRELIMAFRTCARQPFPNWKEDA